MNVTIWEHCTFDSEVIYAIYAGTNLTDMEYSTAFNAAKRPSIIYAYARHGCRQCNTQLTRDAQTGIYPQPPKNEVWGRRGLYVC
jgi:hypothetical protein